MSSCPRSFHQKNHYSCSGSMTLLQQRDGGAAINTSRAGRWLGHSLPHPRVSHHCVEPGMPVYSHLPRFSSEQFNAKLKRATGMLRQCSPGLKCLLIEVFGYVVSRVSSRHRRPILGCMSCSALLLGLWSTVDSSEDAKLMAMGRGQQRGIRVCAPCTAGLPFLSTPSRPTSCFLLLKS